jgi:hydrogenase expression/formation protein HypE
MKVLKTGKIAPSVLEGILGKIEISDSRVTVGPGIGEDAAAIDFGDRFLIVKSDPITFATDRIGWYVVNINANDVAAMGGEPRWFLVTMLLPEERTTPSLIRDIMKDVSDSCRALGISLVGGHTEVTHGLEYPILSGTMLGEAEKNELVQTDGVKGGDLLYMTKGVAIEATSIMARERGDEVKARFGEEFFNRCVGFLEKPGISVIEDARTARRAVRVRGMHDPTEGGLLTGAYEMAKGAGIGLEIDLDRVPVYEETRLLCRHFGLSPYYSTASGSLLIAVKKSEASRLEKAFGNESGPHSPLFFIGEFTKKGEPVRITQKGKTKEISPTGRDELTKLIGL